MTNLSNYGLRSVGWGSECLANPSVSGQSLPIKQLLKVSGADPSNTEALSSYVIFYYEMVEQLGEVITGSWIAQDAFCKDGAVERAQSNALSCMEWFIWSRLHSKIPDCVDVLQHVLRFNKQNPPFS